MESVLGALRHPLSIRACQIVIGVVFAAAGLVKIGDMAAFAGNVHNFRLVPVPLEHLVAMGLPWIELVAAMALILRIRARSGALVTSTMMGVFTAAILSAILRDLDIECGCFGTADATKVGIQKLFENLALLGVSLVATQKPRP